MARTPKDSGAGSELGRLIETTMAAKGLSMRQVSEMSNAQNQRGLSYEHLRKIIKGNTIPSTWVLEAISRTLGIPYPKLLETHQNSEAKMKYGKTVLQSLKLSPELYEIDELIRSLTKDQREMVLNHMRSLAAGNVANSRSAAKGAGSAMKRRA
jgi:transcriptional regulator with XRE-family HTH domain